MRWIHLIYPVAVMPLVDPAAPAPGFFFLIMLIILFGKWGRGGKLG